MKSAENTKGRNGIATSNNRDSILEKAAREKELESSLKQSERFAYTTPTQILLKNALLPVLQRLADESFRRIVMQEEVLIAHHGYSHHPDFFFPAAGLVIEVDGGIHNTEAKMKLDEFTEEKIYNSMGIWVLRVSDSQIRSKALEGILRDIESHLRMAFVTDKKRADSIAVKLSQGRRSFLEENPSKSSSHSKRLRKSSVESEPRTYKSLSKWGGRETIIEPRSDKEIAASKVQLRRKKRT